MAIKKDNTMSKTLSNEQLLEIGKQTIAKREAQKQYDLLYNARAKWMNRQLVKFYNEKGQGVDALKATASNMTLEQLNA